MTIRSGGVLEDMAFLQFHPSLLAAEQTILISEAVRGAGASLVDEYDTPIMKSQHARGDLAPRDVVSRVVHQAIKAGHKIFLDISGVADFDKKFPTIAGFLKQNKIAYEHTQKIPIKPGMHFLMGGVKTDENGKTSLKHLYAVGEVACTGVHGANRLASNSLLEVLAFGKRTALSIIAAQEDKNHENKRIDIATHQAFKLPERAELLNRADQALGVVRRVSSLSAFLDWLTQFQYRQFPQENISKAAVETANLCLVAEIVAQAALSQKTLGAHYIVSE
jgi:L-aspartate oxidase